MSRTKANLLLLLAGAVWGMGFIAQETAMEDIGPMGFIGLRFLIAGLVVLPFALRELSANSLPVSSALNWRFMLVGSIFFIGMALQQVGLLGTTVTNAGFLTALYVVLVPILLFAIFREKAAPIIWPAAFLALVGIYLLNGGRLDNINWGDWLVIACAVFWAFHVIAIGKVGDFSGLPITMACTQFFLCSLLGLVFHAIAGFTPWPEGAITVEAMMGAGPEILYAGAFAGGFAFTLQAVAQRHTTSSAAAILLSSESLFAALFGALFLAERLEVIGYVGCALIFVGILIVELMPPKKPVSANA